MRLHTMKNIVIIAAVSLKDEILRTLEAANVHHYTLFDVVGKGEHTSKDAAESQNIRIESIVSAHVMDEVIERFHHELTGDKAAILYVHDVEVMRHQKFL
jgi:nitrogen regulatory protein PII